MNAIVGFSNLLNEPELTQENRNQYCEIIKTSSNNLLNLIEDILEISIIETGKINLRMEDVNINQFLMLLLKEYTLKNINKLIDIRCLTDASNNELFINTDKNRIRQVLINLINNALKFTRQGFVEFGYKIVHRPQSTVRSPHTSDLILPASYLEFFVRDSGIGISEKNKKMIFERFKQVESENTRTYGGTGLGLAIAKNIVETMGGRIWVESELGKGSTFIFTLPYTPLKNSLKSQVSSLKSQDIIIPDLKNKTILFADDIEVNYTLFKTVIRKTKAVVLWAKDGPECIEMFKINKDIDLVLMDIQMPGMDGIEATKILKQLRKDVPVIAQTAYAMSSDRDRCLEAGCDDYIAKPIMEKELFDILNKHIWQ